MRKPESKIFSCEPHFKLNRRKINRRQSKPQAHLNNSLGQNIYPNQGYEGVLICIFRLINEMKSSANSNSHGDHVSLTRQVESLQSELDIRASSDATRIKDLTDTVSALELENSKLGSDINKLQKAEVFDIAIQTEQAAQSESDVIINLNQMVDYLNQQISQMHLTHETEMSNLMVRS